MIRPFVLLLAGYIAFVSPLGEAQDESFNRGERHSHYRMLAELARIEAATPRENGYIGTAVYERELAKFRNLPADAPPYERFQALRRLGIVEANLGKERDAIAHLEEGLALVFPEGTTLTEHDVDIVDAVRRLATAYLRLGETENCCASPNPDSCIYPLVEPAFHTKREGSEKAIRHLRRLLEHTRLDRYEAMWIIWLLNLGYMTLGEHPDGVPQQWRINTAAESLPGVRTLPTGSPSEFPAFVNVAREAGVDTFSLSGGVAADDFDGDGDIDLLVSSWSTSMPVKFFANDGEGKFTEQDAGLEGINGGLNMTHADYDNDGDLDVFVTRGAWLEDRGMHPNSLLRNNGKGKFVDVTYGIGLGQPALPTQTADWCDYDLDGDLDLFIGNEANGRVDIRCQLYRNDDGLFVDVAPSAGVDVRAFVKGADWGDFDGDRYPDLVLSCLNEPNRLFRNRGDGTFENANHLMPDGGPGRSFPTWFFDYNNDGWLDIFISAYASQAPDYANYYLGLPLPQEQHAALFRNEAGKGFTRATSDAGLVRPMLPMGANYGDLTNNGFPDIYLGTGMPDYDALVPNTLYVNDFGQFFDLTQTARVGHLQKGHAVAMADFDEDGDLDIFEQMGGALLGDQYYDVLFQNPGFGRHWLGVRLRGTESNFYGVGSRVAVLIDEPETGERWIYQWMNTGGSFGSNPLQLHFGLGSATEAKRLEIFWPRTGKTQAVENPGVDQLITIAEE